MPFCILRPKKKIPWIEEVTAPNASPYFPTANITIFTSAFCQGAQSTCPQQRLLLPAFMWTGWLDDWKGKCNCWRDMWRDESIEFLPGPQYTCIKFCLNLFFFPKHSILKELLWQQTDCSFFLCAGTMCSFTHNWHAFIIGLSHLAVVHKSTVELKIQPFICW